MKQARYDGAHLLRAVDAINSPRSVTSASRELSLGCSGRNFKNELYAKADSRKPKPAFLDLVGSAAAIIFTQPKETIPWPASRAASIGRGCCAATLIKMRYRRLDFECTRTKTEASIAISRHPNE
jgi:hypothetical protein